MIAALRAFAGVRRQPSASPHERSILVQEARVHAEATWVSATAKSVSTPLAVGGVIEAEVHALAREQPAALTAAPRILRKKFAAPAALFAAPARRR